jgi:hypothetical protein
MRTDLHQLVQGLSPFQPQTGVYPSKDKGHRGEKEIKRAPLQGYMC